MERAWGVIGLLSLHSEDRRKGVVRTGVYRAGANGYEIGYSTLHAVVFSPRGAMGEGKNVGWAGFSRQY